MSGEVCNDRSISKPAPHHLLCLKQASLNLICLTTLAMCFASNAFLYMPELLRSVTEGSAGILVEIMVE